MSKRVTFLENSDSSNSENSSDSDDKDVEIPSSPSKSNTIHSNTFTVPFISPGLSPIRNQYSVDEDSSDSRSDSSSDPDKDLQIKTEEQPEIDEEMSPIEAKTSPATKQIDESRLSYMSLIDEAMGDRSLVNDNVDESSLHSVSFLPEDDSQISFSFLNCRPQEVVTSIQSSKEQEQQEQQEEQEQEQEQQVQQPIQKQGQPTQRIETNNLNQKSDPVTPKRSSISSTPTSPKSPYLKPGALFTVVLDESGLPILVPVVIPESQPITTFPTQNTSMDEPTKRSTVESFLSSPISRNEHLHQGQHSKVENNINNISNNINIINRPGSSYKQNTSISANSNSLYSKTPSPGKLDSKYFRDRLYRRSLTSVLGYS